MKSIKRFFKRNSHSFIFKGLAGLGRSMNRFYENRNHDIYSNGELTVLKKLAKTNPKIIIDGGANIGKYSLILNKIIPDSTIYSFEPVTDTFEILKQNVKDFNNIIHVNKGLFNENCTKEINIFSSNTHSSIYDIEGISYSPLKKTNIDLISGDDFMAENKIEKIDFLKLDLEGAEYNALEGFSKNLKAGNIRLIQFEFGYINITTKKLLIDYYNFFEKYNFIVGKIFPKILEFRKYDSKYEDFLGPNFVAVHKSDIELINLLSK